MLRGIMCLSAALLILQAGCAAAPSDDLICDTDDNPAAETRAFGVSNVWPLGIVPYAQDAVNPYPEDNMERAINEWRVLTGIEFVRRTDERVYLIFARRGTCSVNSVGYSGNPVTLFLGSCGAGGPAHEIGHALGLHHEHTRTDRDEHIQVNWDQIQSGKRGQFTKRNGRELGPIDWHSIMLYTRGAFACCGNETMTPLDPSVPWHRNTLVSAADGDGVNLLYAEEFEKRDGPPPPTESHLLKLHDGRFEAQVSWTTATESGLGSVASQTETSGTFQFWTPGLWEQVVSVIDGRSFNGHWWVTVASSTDQAWRVEVVDTETGETWSAENLMGSLSPAFVDIEALREPPIR